jgi:hypothetical protein
VDEESEVSNEARPTTSNATQRKLENNFLESLGLAVGTAGGVAGVVLFVVEDCAGWANSENITNIDYD